MTLRARRRLNGVGCCWISSLVIAGVTFSACGNGDDRAAPATATASPTVTATPSVTASPTCAPISLNGWTLYKAVNAEEDALVYPDTQAAYLSKEIYLSDSEAVARANDLLYLLTFTLPYGTYSSLTTYTQDQPYSHLSDGSYTLLNGVANPYAPGSAFNTDPDQRQVKILVVPQARYDTVVSDSHFCPSTTTCGQPCEYNPVAVRYEPPPYAPIYPVKVLLLMRLYYANRVDPNTGRAFDTECGYDRYGYTLFPTITCLDANTYEERDCPLLEDPSGQPDSPLLGLENERFAPPQPPANCPNRQRWDRPQLFWTHFTEAGDLTNQCGSETVEPVTSCNGYLITIMEQNRTTGVTPQNKIVMTYIKSPPTYFDVRNPMFPDPAPDVRYVGIQNYGTELGDVYYDQQSRAVGEITASTGYGGTESGSWVFLHYTRPIDEVNDLGVLTKWADDHQFNVQQLAKWEDNDAYRHGPFLIYRTKEASEPYKSTSPGGYASVNAPCRPWRNTVNGEDHPFPNSPIACAASAAVGDPSCTESDSGGNYDGYGMGDGVLVTVVCNIVNPGALTSDDLDNCLTVLVNTNPDWGPNGANCDYCPTDGSTSACASYLTSDDCRACCQVSSTCREACNAAESASCDTAETAKNALCAQALNEANCAQTCCGPGGTGAASSCSIGGAPACPAR